MRRRGLLRAFALGSLLGMLTVAAPAAAAEEAICSDPNVILCDNFEDRPLGVITPAGLPNLGGKTLGWGSDQAYSQSIVSGSECVGGGKCLQQNYPDLSTPKPQDNGGGGFIGSERFPGGQERTIYTRFWVKYPS